MSSNNDLCLQGGEQENENEIAGIRKFTLRQLMLVNCDIRMVLMYSNPIPPHVQSKNGNDKKLSSDYSENI